MSSKPKLLVVDDERIVCESCTRIFSTQGFSVDTCLDSNEGLRMANEGEYNAVLVDLMMPGLDGLAFLRKLRESNRNVPVIFITGYASVPSAAEAMRLGAADYIPKPFSPDEISSAVRRLVNFKLEDEGAGEEDHEIHLPIIEDSKEAPATADPVRDLFDTVFVPAGERDYLFLDESWVVVNGTKPLEEQSTVAAGAWISGEETGVNSHWQIPKTGDRVVQGLPLAALKAGSKTVRMIPSPVTGRVVEVNHHGPLEMESGEQDACEATWIARIECENLPGDVKRLGRRSVILLTSDESRWADQTAILRRLGCQVSAVKSREEAKQELLKGFSGLLILDGQTMENQGPAWIREINGNFPLVKVAVANDTHFYERSYRMNKILYYSTEPLSGGEVKEIAYSAFGARSRAPFRKQQTGPSGGRINKIQIHTRNGGSVAIVPFGFAFSGGQGLGLELRQSVLQAGYPVEMFFGSVSDSLEVIFHTAKENNRVIMLQAKDLGKVPGTLAEDGDKAMLAAIGDLGSKVKSYIVQPDGNNTEFDARFNQAIADHLINEIAQWDESAAK